MTKVINLHGGPGCGKSTSATGIFSKLKQLNYSVEYVSEYCKDVVWEGTTSLLQNQLHVFSEQFRRQWRLLDKVDYVITDSPLLLSCVYFKHWNYELKTQVFTPGYVDLSLEYFNETFNQFDNINFFINRAKKYVPVGRTQTEDEAKKIDLEILDVLRSRGHNYIETDSQNAINDIVNSIIVNHGK